MADKNPFDDPNLGLAQAGPNPFDDPDTGKPPTILGEAKKGVLQGVDSMQGGLYGLAGAVGKAAGSQGLEDWGRAGVISNAREAQQNAAAVGSLEDIGGVRDAALWASHGLGTLAPYVASTIPLALGGSVAGPAAAGAALGMAGRGALGVVGRAAAQRIGGTVAAGLGSIGQETGSIVSDQITNDGKNDGAIEPGRALAYGIPAGLLDVVPEARVIGKFFGKAATKAARDSVPVDILKQMGMEGWTEGAQTILERGGANKEMLSGEAGMEALNAAAIGALGGGVIGGAARMLQPGQEPDAPPAPPPAEPPLALPAPGTVPIPMGADGPIQTTLDLERQAAADHAAAVYAARDAAEARRAGFPPVEPGQTSPWPDPLALPAPEDANAAAPLTPPALDPNQGPFQPSQDLAQQSAADHAASVEAARAAEEDRRLAAFAAQGPLSAAAATSMGTGMHQAARAARAGEANPESDPMTLPVPIGEEAKALNKTLQERLQKAPSMSLQEAQAARDKAAARDRKAVVLPHPSGGFTIAPASFVAPEVARQFKSLQKAGTLPSPDSSIPGEYTVDSQGNARPSTYGEQNRGQREAFAEMRRQNDTPSQPPIKTAEAAKVRANNLTMQTGVEHEVVPHPMSSTAFAVRPTPAVVEGEVTERRMGLSPTAGKSTAEPAKKRSLIQGINNPAPVSAGPTPGNFAGKSMPETGTAVPDPGIPENAPALSGIDQAAHEAATSLHNDRPQPTAAQAAAGNYKKGHVKLHGLDITVENPAGSVRVDVNGEWANVAPHHYGYIKRTTGKDGDQVDVTVGRAESDRAFVIDQVDPKTGKLDEHKVMLNFASKAEAEQAYRAAYPADWQGFGKIREMDVPALKRWLKHGDNPKPDLSAQALEGLKISIPTEVAETGEVVQVKQDARAALTDARSRVRRLEQLQRCIG